MGKASHIYRVIFINEGKVYEIYARKIFQGNLYGFVEVETLMFGERSAIVVDPAEERLKTEFAGVKRSYIPLHAIIRIDEVEKEGTAKITTLSSKGGGTVTSFPLPAYQPHNEPGDG